MKRSKRRIVIIRHGERVDRVYKRSWIDQCFNEKGEYIRFDLNMPKSLPKGKNKENILLDPPLSQIGLLQSQLIGESFAEHKLNFQKVYCSPSLRCVQTCITILQASKSKDSPPPVAIEPGIFDPFFWTKTCPQWLSNEQIECLGLNVDRNYQPILTREMAYKNKESNIEMFYQRLHRVIDGLLKQIKNEEGDILIVTHGGTVGYGFRALNHYRYPTMEEAKMLMPYIPYCFHIEMEEKDMTPDQEVNDEINKWQMVKNSIPNITHEEREGHDWESYEAKLKESLSL